jgi:6-phosphogluconate dehydrogenase
MKESDIGLVGLAVMVQNLALNIADHGFKISVYNRTTSVTDEFVRNNPDTPGGVVGTKTLEEFVQSIRRPRKIILLVKADGPTDAVIDSLVPLLKDGDIVIDGGNALWSDTIRREKALTEKGLRFIGSGVSGGEEGARFGPSLMPGGDPNSWAELEPIWKAIAPRVDADTGKPSSAAPQTHRRRCAVHRLYRAEQGGAFCQDGAQRYRIRRHAVDLRSYNSQNGGSGRDELHETFTKWNEGDLTLPHRDYRQDSRY